MSNGLLDGMHILIVEDEYLIADGLAREVEAEGAEVVGPVPTLADALQATEREPRIDAAVLDINLRGRMVWPVVDKLMQRGVPIVFATGYDAAIIPHAYDRLPRCEKPVGAERLVDAIRGSAG